jgi:hypothetical protein
MAKILATFKQVLFRNTSYSSRFEKKIDITRVEVEVIEELVWHVFRLQTLGHNSKIHLFHC